jgi:hypothetical protein
MREFHLYRWTKTLGETNPVKENDHAMDEIRYFSSTIANEESKDDFYVTTYKR